MREIKFRAYWVEEKKMLHNVHLFYDTLADKAHGNEVEPEQSFGAVLNEPEKYKVMQFTGLKDKNGKEIFEGDIVRRNFGMCEIMGTETVQIGTVSWVDGGFWFVKANHEYSNLKSCPLEVIGNIYENPELLNRR